MKFIFKELKILTHLHHEIYNSFHQKKMDTYLRCHNKRDKESESRGQREETD